MSNIAISLLLLAYDARLLGTFFMVSGSSPVQYPSFRVPVQTPLQFEMFDSVTRFSFDFMSYKFSVLKH